MSAHVVAALIEAAIPVFAGLYCTALGYRWVGKRPGASPEYDVWHQKHGRTLKTLGPVVVVVGVVLFFINLSRPPA